MDLDTVRLGWSSGLLDLDGFSVGSGFFGFLWIGLGRFFWIWTFWFFCWIWILLVFSLGLDLDGFSFSTGFWFFSDLDLLVFFWIGLGWFFVRNGSVGFQSGLDLKRYFQKALKVKKKKLTDTGFLIVWFF